MLVFITSIAHSLNINYKYDSLNRLVQTEYSDATGTKSIVYVYDAAGNMTSETKTVTELDTDGDGLSDALENSTCTEPYDADSDDDGILDGDEDANQNGLVDAGETDPCNTDTDSDGIQDGTELGVALWAVGGDTNLAVFQPDLDTDTTTDPTKTDSDSDGVSDGEEDLNKNGNQDAGESDPTNNLSIPMNTAPTVPAVNSPAHGNHVAVLDPDLSVNNASDVNGDALTYIFEIYSDAGLTHRIAVSDNITAGNGVTSWSTAGVASLEENGTYYWRCRAFDGHDYGDWMAAASFTIDMGNESPGVPTLSYPEDGGNVPVLQPYLVVTRSYDDDGDVLTYEFEVYSDESMTQLAASVNGINEGDGVPQWRVSVPLTDNTTYWWRARARDSHDAVGNWTPRFSFNIDTADEAPVGLAIIYPVYNYEVTTTSPGIRIDNAVDPDGNPVTYDFQIDTVNTFDSADLQKAVDVVEGVSGETVWTPAQLSDNTMYFIRVRAFDGTVYSTWMNMSFFVNLANNAPGRPTLLRPGNQSQIFSASPSLTITSAYDPDHDALSYEFELFSDELLTQRITQGVSDTLAWQVDVALTHDHAYYWRVRAEDEHGLASEWTTVFTFDVNTNNTPTAPTINNPFMNGTVGTLTPTLSVVNGHSVFGTPLTYIFEIYSDAELEHKVAETTRSEGDGMTSWTVNTALLDESSYYWRAKVIDGVYESAWTETASFIVSLGELNGIKVIEAFADLLADALSEQGVIVDDTESPLYGATLTIQPGELNGDCTITIARITNPPALPDSVVALGPVVDFGPHGDMVNEPVEIRIPYSQALLASAGITNPDEIEIWAYNSTTQAWERIQVADIDTVEKMVVFEADKMTMYVAGADITPEEDDTTDDVTPDKKKDDEEEGCFIQSIL
ncbi:MAG: hypothetical protein WC799_15215 [Desulfobacteraceae bacterium]